MATVSEKTFFRPNEYDLSVLEKIGKENPHLSNTADLIRAALRAWEINQEIGKNLTSRVARLEVIIDELQSKSK